LIEKSLESIRKSYSPYSRFKVGAAVLTKDNSIYSGTNIENISYSLTICAERVAVAKAISEGHKVIKAVAIATNKGHFVPPCGACRQFLKEFCDDMAVILVKSKSEVKIYMLSELLPESFKLKF
jgi:cytidine deaminase (EC 3.5.4.5)